MSWPLEAVYNQSRLMMASQFNTSNVHYQNIVDTMLNIVVIYMDNMSSVLHERYNDGMLH